MHGSFLFLRISLAFLVSSKSCPIDDDAVSVVEETVFVEAVVTQETVGEISVVEAIACSSSDELDELDSSKEAIESYEQ